MQSDNLNELALALAKAQEEMEGASRNNVNPFFKSKYASFSDVVQASRPSLAKHGISVIQRTYREDGTLILETRMLHSSGQWISGYMPLNFPKDDAQSRGSYITYMKRYAYAALVGVYTDDEDDDGEAAVAPQRSPQMSNAPILKKDYERISSDNIKNIMFEIGEHTDIAEKILQQFQIQKMSDIPKEYYLKTIDKIRTTVSQRKNS